MSMTDVAQRAKRVKEMLRGRKRLVGGGAALLALLLVVLAVRGGGGGGGEGDAGQGEAPRPGATSPGGRDARAEAETLATEAVLTYQRGDLSRALDLFAQAEATDRKLVLARYRDVYIRLLVEKADLVQPHFPEIAAEYRQKADRLRKGT